MEGRQSISTTKTKEEGRHEDEWIEQILGYSEREKVKIGPSKYDIDHVFFTKYISKE